MGWSEPSPNGDSTSKLICFIGMHGVGKSSVALTLAKEVGGIHLSVGDLCRLARRGKVPDGVPIRLMAALARHTPGSILGSEVSTHLIDYLAKLLRLRKTICVDGFPSTSGHVEQLAAVPTFKENLRIVHVLCNDELRIARLLRRSQETGRKWSQDMDVSERDRGVASVGNAAHTFGILKNLCNDGPINDLLPELRRILT